MDEFKYYEIMGNSDQTEGRGPMVMKQTRSTEDAAVAWARSPEGQRECGVMGHGYGEVVEVVLMRKPDGRVAIKRTKIWGYRKDWTDHWGHGYLDLRDKPEDDPEWPEYLRLQEKFNPTGKIRP